MNVKTGLVVTQIYFEGCDAAFAFDPSRLVSLDDMEGLGRASPTGK